MQITTIDDLVALWPDSAPIELKPGGRERGGPCPFCTHDSASTLKVINGKTIYFSGTDRLVLRDNNTMYCRVCNAQGRGHGVGGNWYMRDLQNLFGFTIAAELSKSERSHEDSAGPIQLLWFDRDVEEAHKNVHYDFWWDKCRWPKEVVDEFKLGYGTLFSWHGPAHIIPMDGVQKYYQEPLLGWYISARSETHKIRKVKNKGSNAGHFWLKQRKPETRTVIIAEGEKENITHAMLGYENTFAAFGSTIIYKDMLKWLWEQGYRHLILAGDNDEAGQAFNQKLAGWAQGLSFDSVEAPLWPSFAQEGWDTTDLLVHNNGDVQLTRQQFDSWLAECIVLPPPAMEISDDGPDREIYPREELRGKGPNSVEGRVRRFIETYEKNSMALLSPSAGTGKTHTLVTLVEEWAREHLLQRAEERLNVERDLYNLQMELRQVTDEETRIAILEKIKSIENRLADWSVAGVAWLSLFKSQWSDFQHFNIDKSLWFEFKARNETNCGNFEIANELGQNNHSIGRFCETTCPLRDMCKKTGYLSQDAERRSKPITVFRHNQIYMTVLSEYPKAVIIDENITPLLEEPLIIKPHQLNPFDPDKENDLEDDYEYMLLKNFMQAVRQAMSFNAGATMEDPDRNVHGADVFRLIEAQLDRMGMPFEETLNIFNVDVLNLYQPNFYGDSAKHVKLRCAHDLIKVLQRELPAYLEDKNHKKPSCLHLIEGKLHVFVAERVRLPASVPLICLDATAMTETYQAMFNRKIEEFRPDMVNPNCETIVLNGTDYPKKTFNYQLGKYTAERKQLAKQKEIYVKSDPNNPIQVEDLPHGQEAYGSELMQDVIQLINAVAAVHKDLLVVSYKDLKELAYDIFKTEYPDVFKKIAWGHYGNLRGTNLYEDYEAALLIGAYRVPYEQVYLYVSMWASLLGYDDPINPEIVRKNRRYHGTQEIAEYVTFASAFADRYVNAREEAEMQQCLERIRPHASEAKKTVYVAAKRPITRHTTKIMRKIEFVKNFVGTRSKTIKQFVTDYMQQQIELFGADKAKPPTYLQIAKVCGGSHSTIRKVLKEMKDEQDKLAAVSK